MTTESSTHITTRILRGGKIPLTISYACTSSGISIPRPELLQSLIDLAVMQWHDSLTNLQRSGPSAKPTNLLISASFPESQRS